VSSSGPFRRCIGAPIVERLEVGNPATPDQFIAVETLWTDEEWLRYVFQYAMFCYFFGLGCTIVERNSHRAHVDILGPRLTVGSVYKVTGYGLQMPRKSYRAASYDHVIGCGISVTRRNHINGTHGMATAQVVVLVDAQSFEFSVTLWEDFSLILDPVSLAEADLRKPVVIGLAGLMVSSFNCFERLRALLSVLMFLLIRLRNVLNTLLILIRLFLSYLLFLLILLICYKIKMRASDDSGTTTFVLLGRTTDYIMPVSAADLVRAFSAIESTLPPPIEKLRQRILTFEVQVLLNPRSSSSSKRLMADMDDSSGESDDSDVSHGYSPSLSTPIPEEVRSLADKVSLVGESCDRGVCEELSEPVVSPKRSPLLSNEIAKKASSRTKRRLVQSKASFATEELSDPGVSIEQLHVLSTLTPKTTGVRGKRRPRKPKDSTSDHLCLIVVPVFPGVLLGRRNLLGVCFSAYKKTDASLSPKAKCLDTAGDDNVPLRVFARRAKRQASSPDLSV
ncbi:hypothetical protein LINPERHAP2_LOCUS12524, partial [Linum perenne]